MSSRRGITRSPYLVAFYRSPWFVRYLLLFLAAFTIPRIFLLYLSAMMGSSSPTLLLGPLPSLGALAFELSLIHLATRLRGEHILLTNLGLSVWHLSVPFATLHLILEILLHRFAW
jgi:hypothetical protein